MIPQKERDRFPLIQMMLRREIFEDVDGGLRREVESLWNAYVTMWQVAMLSKFLIETNEDLKGFENEEWLNEALLFHLDEAGVFITEAEIGSVQDIVCSLYPDMPKRYMFGEDKPVKQKDLFEV